MDHIYGIAQDHHIKLVELGDWVDNVVAKNFYMKHWFTKYREFVYKKL
ncbi:N-acetyltransferase [Bacillus fonticola]|nr:hypothetical protein [Bacillus fonticola]